MAFALTTERLHPSAQRFFPLMAVLLASLALPYPVQASEKVYLLYRQWQPYEWPEDRPTAADASRSQRGLGWHRRVAGSRYGADYDYQPLRIRTGDPAHNGHLHRFAFTGLWQDRHYRLEARAGVAGTSNMFKHRDFHQDVLNGRLAIFRALGDGSPLSLGVGGDHRFGSFRWLPRVRWEHGHESGQWLVDLPVLLHWQSPGGRWGLRLERKGDRWATLDRSRQVESALYLREWRTELTYRASPSKGLRPSVILGLGASVDTQVRYRDLAAGTRDLRVGSALTASVKLGW